MRFSSLLFVTILLILLATAAGCTSSSPKSGTLTTVTETTVQPAAATTTAPAATTVVSTTTTAKCPTGQNACADGTCRDFATDHDACGGCGNVCPAGYICKASECVNPAMVIVTQAPPEETTSIPNNPVTTAIQTTTTSLSGYKRGSFSDIQFASVVETTYPPDVQYIDCSKYPITITSIVPSSGPKAGGTPVVIHGSGFKRGAYKIVTVMFGPSSRRDLIGGAASDTEIVLDMPARGTAGTIDIQVAAIFNGVSNNCMSPVTAASKFTYT